MPPDCHRHGELLVLMLLDPCLNLGATSSWSSGLHTPGIPVPTLGISCSHLVPARCWDIFELRLLVYVKIINLKLLNFHVIPPHHSCELDINYELVYQGSWEGFQIATDLVVFQTIFI